MREADRILRRDERNWLLVIDGVDKETAEKISLNKSEDHYTQVIQYDPDKDRGYAVYAYWRYWEDKDLPPICEAHEWKIKRLEHAIKRHKENIQEEQERVEELEEELTLISELDPKGEEV